MTTVAARAPLTEAQIEEAARWRWKVAIRRELLLWSHDESCPRCGEVIGHHGGDMQRDPCPVIPADVPLEEIRPNRYVVRRHCIGDAIRAVCAS